MLQDIALNIQHSSVETIQRTQKAAAMGKLLAASSQQRARSHISLVQVFCKTLNHPGDSVPL